MSYLNRQIRWTDRQTDMECTEKSSLFSRQLINWPLKLLVNCKDSNMIACHIIWHVINPNAHLAMISVY